MNDDQLKINQNLLNSAIELNLALIELRRVTDLVLESSQRAAEATKLVYAICREHHNIN